MIPNGEFLGDKGNNDTLDKESSREVFPIDSNTFRKWKKIAPDLSSNDSPMQVTVLTKRSRSHGSTNQPELHNNKIQVLKVEDHENSMVEAIKQPCQSK